MPTKIYISTRFPPKIRSCSLNQYKPAPPRIFEPLIQWSCCQNSFRGRLHGGGVDHIHSGEDNDDDDDDDSDDDYANADEDNNNDDDDDDDDNDDDDDDDV